MHVCIHLCMYVCMYVCVYVCVRVCMYTIVYAVTYVFMLVCMYAVVVEAESNEYIESLREDVAWLGWKPNPTTHTSDYFDKLYELAVELIKKDKAYVCHQTKVQIEAEREISKKRLADPTFQGMYKFVCILILILEHIIM